MGRGLRLLARFLELVFLLRILFSITEAVSLPGFALAQGSWLLLDPLLGLSHLLGLSSIRELQGIRGILGVVSNGIIALRLLRLGWLAADWLGSRLKRFVSRSTGPGAAVTADTPWLAFLTWLDVTLLVSSLGVELRRRLWPDYRARPRFVKV